MNTKTESVSSSTIYAFEFSQVYAGQYGPMDHTVVPISLYLVLIVTERNAEVIPAWCKFRETCINGQIFCVGHRNDYSLISSVNVCNYLGCAVMKNLKFTYLQGRSLKIEIKSNNFACPQYGSSYIQLELLEERISEFIKLTMNQCVSTTELKGWPMFTLCIA
jgi:hypothetical protein